MTKEIAWDYLDGKVIEAKIQNDKKTEQFQKEDDIIFKSSELLKKSNHKEYKSTKQKTKAHRRARIERNHIVNISKFGLYRLKDTKEGISAYQQHLVTKNGVRVRTVDNKTKWFLPSFTILYKSKVEFLGALNNMKFPYFKYKISDGSNYYYQRCEGDIDRGVLCDAYGMEGDATTYIKDTRNTWIKWFKDKVIPFSPNFASNDVIASPNFNNMLDLLLNGNPQKTGIESIELLLEDNIVGYVSLFDTFKKALEEGMQTGSQFLISNSRVQLHLTGKDGRLHKEKYPKYGYALVVFCNSKDLDSQVYFTNKKGKKQRYYSQNIKKDEFSANEIMPALFACEYSKGAKAISYNAPLCKNGYTLYGNKVLDFDTIVQNCGVKRNIDVTCKKYANSTYKEMQPALLGLGGNFIPLFKVGAYICEKYKETILGLPENKRVPFILNIVKSFGVILDKESPKPFKVMDSGIQKITYIIFTLLNSDPDKLHRIGCSCGSLIRNAARHATDLKKIIFQSIRQALGYITDGVKESVVFIADKIVDYSKFLNAGIIEAYNTIFENYKNIRVKSFKVGWQKRYAIVYIE